ncbi:MAG: hypothetical protein LBL15_05670 [Oscillospiraceae bacterium]|jgi:hypothetical protein|nr:hypothetical protein [Oscillospiraceae bacterium]
MLLDIIDIEKVRRALVYFGVMLAVLFVQSVILSRVTVLGVRAFIAPVAVVAVGFFEGGVWGGVFGLLLGLFSDMHFNDVPVLLTAVFPLIGFLSGALAAFFVNRRFFSFFFVSLAALGLTAACQMLRFIAAADTALLPVLTVAGLQTLWSLPFTFAIYYPCRSLSGVDLSQ